MEELTILKYQAEEIENALRLSANTLNSYNKESETALDRNIIKALEMIRDILKQSK